MRIDFCHADCAEHVPLSTQSSMRHPYWKGKPARQRGNAFDVVAVFMRNQNTAEMFGLQTESCEAGNRFATGKPAIHHYNGGTGLHHQCVAFAATAEKGKTHLWNLFYCGLFFQILEQRIENPHGFLAIQIGAFLDGHVG
mgnify:CR=1 FL=1